MIHHLLAAVVAVSPGLTVSPDTSVVTNIRVGATCWAGVVFSSLGTENENTPANSFTVSRGNWLDAGDSSEVWIERTINSGPGFNVDDPGAGRLQLNVNRKFNQNRTTIGVRTTNVTFDFWDAASGGNQLATVTYDVIAEQTA